MKIIDENVAEGEMEIMLLIQLHVKDVEFSKQYVELIDGVIMIESKELMADESIVQYLVPLATITAPIIIAWIKSYYDAKKAIRVKYKGLEIQGLNEKNIEKIIGTIIENGEYNPLDIAADEGDIQSDIESEEKTSND